MDYEEVLTEKIICVSNDLFCTYRVERVARVNHFHTGSIQAVARVIYTDNTETHWSVLSSLNLDSIGVDRSISIPLNDFLYSIGLM